MVESHCFALVVIVFIATSRRAAGRVRGGLRGVATVGIVVELIFTHFHSLLTTLL